MSDLKEGSGFGIEIGGDLSIQVGRLADEMEKERKRRQRDALDTPARYQLATNFTFSTAAGAGICPNGGSGFGVILGGPDLGYQWSIRQVFVGGQFITTAPGGVAWLMRSASADPSLNPLNVMDFSHAPLPSIAFYSTGELYVVQNENLFVVITGGTNGTTYTASATVEISRYAPASAGTEIEI